MKEEEIREGDIVEIDYIAEFTKEHINEGKALIIWKGHNNQPLVRKLNTKKTIWTCYEHIARVVGHIDLEGYMDEALKNAVKPTELLNDELAEVIEYDEDGEYIWLVQNHTTGKMSTGFTKGDAIHNYNEGKVFNISEWED